MSTLGRLLHPLPKKDQALLLTLLTYGGNEWESLLKFYRNFKAAPSSKKVKNLVSCPWRSGSLCLFGNSASS